MYLQKIWLLSICMLIVKLENDPLKLDNKEDQITNKIEQILDNKGNNKQNLDEILDPEKILENQSKIKPWENDKEDQLTQNEFIENKNQNNIKGICNIDLLKQFGININEENQSIQRPFVSNAIIKGYCRRNVNSCCLGEEIMQLERYFTKAKKELEQKFQPLQEMIVLFKGNKYEDILFEVQQKEECQQILLNSPIYKTAHNKDHFMNTILPTEIDRMMSLLTDSEIYVKKNYWYYGNMICVICNPNQVEYIHLTEDKPYIDYNINNCAESIEMSEFENRAIMAYEFFFKTWVYLSQCLTDNYQNPEYKVPDLDIKDINQNMQKYSQCYKEFDFTSDKCKELCSQRKFDKYEFPIKFFNATMIALKNLFPIFTDISLDEFYEKTKQITPEELSKDEPITFFESFNGSKLNEAEIKVNESKEKKKE